MDLLSWLIVGHLAGDFLLQTAWMAQNKEHGWAALVAHSLVYSLAVAGAALLVGGLPLAALAVIFCFHLALDRRRFVRYWVRVINRTEDQPWIYIVVDQAWHLVVLAAVTRIF